MLEGSTSAYGVVTAKAWNGPEGETVCSNTVRVFYAADGVHYKQIYQRHREGDGLGVALVGWSKATTKLLFRLYEWPYDSDADTVNTAFVYDKVTAQVNEVPIAKAITKRFGSDCEFDQRVLGWEGADSVLVRVSKAPLTEHHDQVFCVQKPQAFVFNLTDNTLRQRVRRNKERNHPVTMSNPDPRRLPHGILHDNACYRHLSLDPAKCFHA